MGVAIADVDVDVVAVVVAIAIAIVDADLDADTVAVAVADLVAVAERREHGRRRAGNDSVHAPRTDMPRARSLSVLAALALALGPPPALAEGPRPIRHDLAVDGAVTGAALSAWLASELAKPALAPARCRICEPGALDAAAREAVVWSSPARARRTSDVLVFALLPAGVATHQLLAARRAGDAREGLVDVLVVVEAVALSADLTQAVKYAAGRKRPRALHAGPGAAPGPDDDLSFFSGHTSLAFSLVAAAGTVSTLRGYPSAPWMWGAGTALAAGAGWLRMAGDAHWLTDVLTGAAVGTAVGIAVPRLLHGREAAPGSAPQPSAAAPVVGIALAF